MTTPRISDALYKVAMDAMRKANYRYTEDAAVAVATAVLDHVSDELERSGQTRAALYVARMTTRTDRTEGTP